MRSADDFGRREGCRVLVFSGRFQPFHEGHAEVVEACLERGERLAIAVVVAMPFPKDRADPFDRASAEHFARDRNLWCPLEVLRMVDTLIAARWPDRATSFLLPRPSRGLAWGAVECMLPGHRVWVVPERGEEWDEKKAAFFASMGDEVLRIPLARRASGRSIRRAVAVGADLGTVGVPVEIRALCQGA